jgi:dipeptidyl aminopeptidase/acylaminoacyl peptidase
MRAAAIAACLFVAPTLVHPSGGYANGSSAHAQGRKADYERADKLRSLTQNKVFRSRVQPNWFDEGRRFWYRVETGPGTQEFVLVDTVAGKRVPAFDHARVAAALARAGGKPVEPGKLPIRGIRFMPDGRSLVLYGQTNWRLDLTTYALTEATGDAFTEGNLRNAAAPYPSRTTGEETSITFVNGTGGELRVFWMDTDGNRQPYGTLAAGARRDQHTFAGHVWILTDAGGAVLGVFEATEAPGTAVVDGAPRQRPPRRQGERRSPRADAEARSPDGTRTAFVRDHNIWLREGDGSDPVALTNDGTADDAYGDIRWSPDSAKIAALKTKAAQEHKVTIVESSPSDQVQPKLRVFDYLKPGDRVAHPRPCLFDVAARRAIPIADDLFPNPYDLGEVRWEPDGKRFTFFYNQRGHQVLRIVAVNASTGAASVVVDEQSKTFVDYAGKRFTHYADATGEILWMSERDGWNHLYLFDARTGAVKNRVTQGAWVVRGVDRVDDERRLIWFRLSGYHPGQDPYHVHYARIGFDGKGLTLLTDGDGTHTLAYGPDGKHYLDTYSRVDLPPVTELRRTEDGKLVCVLEKADASALLKTGWRMPERFVAKGRDGATDIHGIIHRPTNFRPGRKYPVIEAIYAGPHSSHVPKAWSALHGAQVMAELGFVVVQIDGMGTSNRSKAFHDVCWRNLADAGFPDRIAWMKAAAKTRPCMDLSRVGIYGGSAGGQNALGGLLFHPEFYKVGVADCGCHDNRMDKIWWNELWMGWPVGPHYAESSNVTHAGKLQGKLMLVVGETDTNVDPASTMQVVNALVKADKDFDLLVMPGVGHGATGPAYGQRRMRDFLVRHLLGVEPRRE